MSWALFLLLSFSWNDEFDVSMDQNVTACIRLSSRVIMVLGVAAVVAKDHSDPRRATHHQSPGLCREDDRQVQHVSSGILLGMPCLAFASFVSCLRET